MTKLEVDSLISMVVFSKCGSCLADQNLHLFQALQMILVKTNLKSIDPKCWNCMCNDYLHLDKSL